MIDTLLSEEYKSITAAIVAAIVVVSGYIEIQPIKINPWTWLFSPLRKALLGGAAERLDCLDKKICTLNGKIDCVDKKVEDMKRVRDDDNAESRRVRVLRFAQEVSENPHRSRDNYQQAMRDISEYKGYCNRHPDFVNSIADGAMEFIQDTYQEMLRENGFSK